MLDIRQDPRCLADLILWESKDPMAECDAWELFFAYMAANNGHEDYAYWKQTARFLAQAITDEKDI